MGKDKRGRGIWKMNNTLLKDQQYVERVKEYWKIWKTKKGEYFSILDWWDKGKAQIKTITREYSKQRAKQTRTRNIELQQRLQILRQEHESGQNRWVTIKKK